MNPGMPYETAIATIERNAARKEDFLTPARNLQVSGNVIRLNDSQYEMTKTMNQQLASWLKLPKSTYDRLKKEYTPHFNGLANEILVTENADMPRMFRTFKPEEELGQARALLSSRFFRLDHDRIASMLLPIIANTNLTLRSLHVGDEDFHIQASDERRKSEVRVGEWVEMGIHIKDNEVGKGMMEMNVFIYNLACTNGAIRKNMSKTRRHVGETLFSNEDSGILTREAAEAATEATALAFRDHLNYLLSEGFDKYIEDLKIKAGEEVTINRGLVVQKMANDFGFSDTEREKLASLFYRDEKPTIWSIANHVTELANDRKFEAGIELQEAGGNILDYSTTQWRAISSWNTEADVPRQLVFA